MKGGGRVRVDESSVNQHFIGIMIPVVEPFIGLRHKPGWRCRWCGWEIGCSGLPPEHTCPEAARVCADKEPDTGENQ